MRGVVQFELLARVTTAGAQGGAAQVHFLQAAAEACFCSFKH